LTWLLALVLLDYEGRFASDPRIEVVRNALPDQLSRARRRVGVDEPVRIRLEDMGQRPPGAVARTVRDADGLVIVLAVEPLLLRTHDPESTLAHELVHVLQKSRWGALRGVTMPAWVVEGMAVHRSGQLPERARILAAHVGREKDPADAVGRLVNGLGGRHTLLDYFEDGAAFAAVEQRHGKEKCAAFSELLLAGRPPSEAASRALGESMETFEDRSRDAARRMIEPLIRDGRDRLLALRAAVEAGRFAEAVKLPESGGVYGAADAYYRALAREGMGGPRAARKLLRERLLDQKVRASTLLVPALDLDDRLTRKLGEVPPDRPELLAYREENDRRDVENRNR